MKRNVQNTKFQTPNTNKGITLVALVITIIVLLILAGVAINMAINSDGLFGKANEASKKWNESVENETDAIEDLLKEIGVINWEKAKAEAVAPASQVTVPKTTIGIDAKGEVVNMDLWKFNLDTVTGGYGLQDTIAFTATASADIKALEEVAGYRGDFTNVYIPQYISTDSGATWTPVTNLDWTFYGCTELTQIDNIPDTVVSMRYTFRDSKLSKIGKLPSGLQNMVCTFFGTEITTMPVIPESVNNMYGTFGTCKKLMKTTSIPEGVVDLTNTFNSCEKLEQAPEIPYGVENMKTTFFSCKALKKAPTIPSSVKNMYGTFFACSSLETASTIPSSVTNIGNVYKQCPKLRGSIEINASVTGAIDENGLADYTGALYKSTEEGLTLTVSGTCEFIDEIIAEVHNPRITKATN